MDGASNPSPPAITMRPASCGPHCLSTWDQNENPWVGQFRRERSWTAVGRPGPPATNKNGPPCAGRSVIAVAGPGRNRCCVTHPRSARFASDLCVDGNRSPYSPILPLAPTVCCSSATLRTACRKYTKKLHACKSSAIQPSRRGSLRFALTPTNLPNQEE